MGVFAFMKIFKRVLAVIMLIAMLASGAAASEDGAPEGMPTAASAGVQVSAKSAILMEASTGRIIFEKNADEFLNPASVTKIMTVLLIIEAIDRGDLAYDTVITTSERAASMGGSQIWLKVGEQMTVKDMLKAICIVSANDAASAMAEQIGGSIEGFAEMMNERAKELGCTNTNFVNATGLDTPGHGTTARDIANISRELIKHKEIREYTTAWMDSLRGGESQLTNTNKLIKTYNGITGLKTGSTSVAKYCLSATAERDGTEFIAVVVCAPTSAERFADAARLLDYGYANYKTVELPIPEIAPIPVVRGKKEIAEVGFDGMGEKLLLKKADGDVRYEVEMAENIGAPVTEGQIVGKITYFAGDTQIADYDIKTLEAVAEITFSNIWNKMLSNIMMK